jgi:N-acetylmuramoyl-L-alanine amidase-like protein
MLRNQIGRFVFFPRFAIALLIVAPLARSQGMCTLNVPLMSGGLRSMSEVNTIVLHHTAISTLGNSLATLRVRGLSYHYLIDSKGTVLRAVPPQKLAFHAAGANRGSIGISFVGGDSPPWFATDAQWKAATRLVGNLVKKYPQIRYVMGHGDVRDSNAGEPYNVSFDQMIDEVRTLTKIELHHPGFEEEPLKDFRQAALYIQDHPRPAVRLARPRRVRKVETMTCADGKIHKVPVTWRR